MSRIFKEKECEICGKLYKPTSSTQRYCIECGNKNKKEYNKQWNEKNKEHRKEYSKQWREQNKEYSKQWREQNKEYKKEYDKQWNEKNKEHRKEYYKQWSERNKEHRREYKKNWSKVKYNTDLQYKLIDWSRKQVRRCLKYISTDKTKDEHTFDILGYTPEQLKQRLEMNFKPDMTWENHGILWHIDHRKPLCKFNFVLQDGTPNYKQIRLANSLANLQPLYQWENLSKGGK